MGVKESVFGRSLENDTFFQSQVGIGVLQAGPGIATGVNSVITAEANKAEAEALTSEISLEMTRFQREVSMSDAGKLLTAIGIAKQQVSADKRAQLEAYADAAADELVAKYATDKIKSKIALEG